MCIIEIMASVTENFQMVMEKALSKFIELHSMIINRVAYKTSLYAMFGNHFLSI